MKPGLRNLVTVPCLRERCGAHLTTRSLPVVTGKPAGSGKAVQGPILTSRGRRQAIGAAQCPLLPAPGGGGPSDAAGVWKRGAADGGTAAVSEVARPDRFRSPGSQRSGRDPQPESRRGRTAPAPTVPNPVRGSCAAFSGPNRTRSLAPCWLHQSNRSRSIRKRIRRIPRRTARLALPCWHCPCWPSCR